MPLPDTPGRVAVPEEVVLALTTMNDTPITAEHIARWTATDPILSQVLQFVERGWPCDVTRDCESYTRRKEELSVQHGVLIWGARVVVPPKGHDTLLKELHETHPGIAKMKALARSYIWWPGLDAEIERCVKDCTTCQLHSKQPPLAPLHPWEWPGRTWHRIHIDYAGPFEGRMILIIVERSFMAGDSVWTMNFLGQPKWVAAVIENRLGPLNFALRLQDNRVWKRHQDHLRERRPNESTEERLCSEERQLQPQLYRA